MKQEMQTMKKYKILDESSNWGWEWKKNLNRQPSSFNIFIYFE